MTGKSKRKRENGRDVIFATDKKKPSNHMSYFVLKMMR